jgi:5-formyltetrahydrofolate cyclo-ligase
MLFEHKTDARRYYRHVRRMMPLERRGEAEQLVRQALLVFLNTHPVQSVAGYYPVHDELNVLPLLAQLRLQGVHTLLPRTHATQRLLTFHHWSGTIDTLAPDAAGIPCPTTTEHFLPDLILVPGLAFTKNGERLGYGKGYYDATLSVHSLPRAHGIAFREQEALTLPTDAHDCRLTTIWWG